MGNTIVATDDATAEMVPKAVESSPKGPQILILGLPRTGTTSLRVALRQMGFNKHYYWDTMNAGCNSDMGAWIQLLEKKYHGTGAITREDFDAILADYTSLADFPCSAFTEELIAAYPQAKVILSVRDNVDIWSQSFENTVWRYHRRKNFPQTFSERFWAYFLDNQLPQQRVMDLIMHNTPFGKFPTQGRQWYVDHNNMVRNLVPHERLLEFNAKDGYEPLCRFLRTEQPETAYPCTNAGEGFQKGVDKLWVRWKARKAQGWAHQLTLGLIGLAGMLILCEIKYRYSSSGS